MTRFEKIREHLLGAGPQTSRQVAVAMGWKYNSAQSACCHARSYGYIEEAGRAPRRAESKSHCGETLWKPRPFLIRKPAQ